MGGWGVSEGGWRGIKFALTMKVITVWHLNMSKILSTGYIIFFLLSRHINMFIKYVLRFSHAIAELVIGTF